VRVQQQGIRFDDRNVMQRHRRMNVEFGTPGYAGNAAVEAMMRRIEQAR
jgi:exosome complex RNA-binding protein Rrp42 (RNase PH superfamily)